MKPFSYYRQYSLVGISRNSRKPSKEDLPEPFVKLLEHMGFEIEEHPDWMKDCLGISRGVGTQYIARVDFKQGIVIALEKENLGKIRPLGLEELPMRNICFSIPDTYGGGTMHSERDIEERIPRFRDYLKKCSFELITGASYPEVKKKFTGKKCGELWQDCIEVFPYEPYGEELVRLCSEFK
jgi:hypothetical protein